MKGRPVPRYPKLGFTVYEPALGLAVSPNETGEYFFVYKQWRRRALHHAGILRREELERQLQIVSSELTKGAAA